MSDSNYPLALFRFHVDFERVSLSSTPASGLVAMCQGAFSECSGLEATMEPKVIKGGGWNYGAPQRTGPVTFGTVVLKRGMTTTKDLWHWFSEINQAGRYAFRLNVTIRVAGPNEELPGTAITITLARALPTKFQYANLNARATEVGIEELHLVHEGMSIQ